MKNKYLLGHSMALLTIIIWGVTFISTKVLLRNLQPVEILFYRFLMGYLALLLIYPKFEKVGNWKEELLFLGSGVCGVTLYFFIENMALKYTLASNVGLLVSVIPILTALLAHTLTRDEKFDKNLVLGFIIAIAGIFLVVFNGNFVLKLNPAGDLLAVMAAVTWSVYSILLKKIGSKYNHIYITRKIFFYGIVSMIPMLLIFRADFNISIMLMPDVLLNLLFLGVVASALCFVMWNTAVSLIGVVKTSNYIYLVPLITIISAVLVLHEVITNFALLGAVFILSGVYVSEHGFVAISAFQTLFNSLKKIRNKSAD